MRSGSGSRLRLRSGPGTIGGFDGSVARVLVRYPGGQEESHARPDSSGKGTTSRRRLNAHGLAQEELNTRLRPEQANELSPDPDPDSDPNRNLNLALNLLRISEKLTACSELRGTRQLVKVICAQALRRASLEVSSCWCLARLGVAGVGVSDRRAQDSDNQLDLSASSQLAAQACMRAAAPGSEHYSHLFIRSSPPLISCVVGYGRRSRCVIQRMLIPRVFSGGGFAACEFAVAPPSRLRRLSLRLRDCGRRAQSRTNPKGRVSSPDG